MSNIANLQAAVEVDRVNQQQGWTTTSYLQVLCDFITLSQLWPQVLTYVKERAAEENNPDQEAP